MAQSPTPFCAQKLYEALFQLPGTPTYWVGFSGGADSAALIHALHELNSQLTTEIKVLHVNHGLAAECDSWESRCIETCKRLGLEILTRRINVGNHSGTGMEAEARRLRYGVVEEILAPGETLLTAHHQEDQAETLLLNLMRGSGVDGLAGMPMVRPLGKGLLARPLLDFSMVSLRHYLEERQLSWIEDPSNLDLTFDRNFVRHRLVPLLSERWPGVSQRIAKRATLSRNASERLSRWAEEQLANHLQHLRVLDLNQLDPSAPEFALIVRQWLRKSQTPSLPARQIQELAAQCMNGSQDTRLCIAWQGWTIRGFDHRLWLQNDKEITNLGQIPWSQPGSLDLGSGSGILSLDPSPDDWPENLFVKTRQGGERLLSVGGERHKSLKDIFRELRIPPWLRDSVPLLSNSQELLAVGDFVVSNDLRNWLVQHSSSLVWQPDAPLLRFVHQQCHCSTVDPV